MENLKYICEFPDCEYSTHHRTQIHHHHIIPVERGGENKRRNRIFLCPNHHTKIFIPEATAGIHAVQGEDSIVLKGWLQSTAGLILNYIDQDGDEQYYEKKKWII